MKQKILIWKKEEGDGRVKQYLDLSVKSNFTKKDIFN